MSKRILFVLASPEYLRYYDTTMTALAERGHHVAVSVNWLRERKHARLAELIADSRIDILGQAPSRDDVWVHWARAVRGTFDFVRYLHPRLAGASALRERSKRKSAPRIFWGLDRIRTLSPKALERVYSVLRLAENAIPVSGRLQQFLRDIRPDLVVVSPLVDAMSAQVDVVRAAQSLGIPAALAVASWDNLTNKGHLRVVPDAVMVWNEHQKQEAVSLHGVPPDRVAVTGAQLFDRWFDRQPSQSREGFAAMVGLPADRPFILYTGSSIFIARSEHEVPFVRRWLAALRASDVPELRDAAVLIRPHPFNAQAWEQADFSGSGAVAVWPRQRYTPASESSRDSLFDSLYYSSAVVGINTSAMIEAAILSKPVLSVITPEFARTQEGTVHFHYLLPENGGFLRIASSFGDHVTQLADILRNPDAAREQLDRFVDSFIRPHGRAHACTPRLCDALERASTTRRAATRDSFAVRLIRIGLWPLAVMTAWLSPSLDADGKPKDAWWRRFGPAWERLIKRLVIRPARLSSRALGRGARALGKRLRHLGRALRAVLSRARRLVRHARYHIAVRVRGTIAPTDGTDGRS